MAEKNRLKDLAAAVGIGAAATWAGNAIFNSFYNNISYEYLGARFDFNGVYLGNIGVLIDLKIINKNNVNVGCTVRQLKGALYYGMDANNQPNKVATLDVPQAFIVPQNGENNFTINATANAQELIQDIINIFSSSNGMAVLSTPLVFKGTLYTNVVNVPLNFNIPITIGA